jgi:hypothetical protein
MSAETRQKIPVPRRFFLWSLNQTSGEILTHAGPTEFTPSANDRIVRILDKGGYQEAPMEARPFVVAQDGEYVLLSNPVVEEATLEFPNGAFVPGGNKEKNLKLGTKKVIPGPCAFLLWPGQNAEVRPAHKLSPNHYVLCEVVGPVDQTAPNYKDVLRAAQLSSAIIDSEDGGTEPASESGPAVRRELTIGQRLVIQGRHTQYFIPPSGIDIIPPLEEMESKDDADGTLLLPPNLRDECAHLVAQVASGLSHKQFGILKNELRHRQDLTIGQRAIFLAALDEAQDSRDKKIKRDKSDRAERRMGYADPYARRAVVLGPKEFCVLYDADGRPRIVRGPARVSPGPDDTFMIRGSRRRVYDAYELGENQALWIRIVTSIGKAQLAKLVPSGTALDRETYEPGDELIIRGQPSVFFPFIESEIIHPGNREIHVGNDHEDVVITAIGIDQRSGIYVRNLRTGRVQTVRGERSYLVDPRFEEHVTRTVPSDRWRLWTGEAAGDEIVASSWAVSIAIPNNEAVMVTSHDSRRVEVGPKAILLGYEEELAQLHLSRGQSKDGKSTIPTCFLRVSGARVADTFLIESSDFVQLQVKIGFTGHFEAPSEDERVRWFAVEDPVKLLADTVRARLRRAARSKTATELHREIQAIVDREVLGDGGRLRFPENGMVLTAANVLACDVADADIASTFKSVLKQAVQLSLEDEAASRRLESERLKHAIDAEEQAILREASRRKAETHKAESEAHHEIELRALQLRADRKDVELDRSHAQERKVLGEKVTAMRANADATAAAEIRRAEGDAEANAKRYAVEEAHLAALGEVEKARTRSLAEADALKLTAIQPELVGALHAAADSVVMKAAAENMNLVSLLGGRTPSDLFSALVRGTPLERTVVEMASRTNGHSTRAEPAEE